MGYELRDLVAHHNWATRQLLGYCRQLDDATLATSVPGTYGSVIDTLRHLINAEGSYLYRLTGAWAERPWAMDEPADLATLTARAGLLATALEHFAAGDWDGDRPHEARGPGGERFEVAAGVWLTQTIHHANEHRAHVCSVLGALGLEPPDVSAWGYALATGRMTPARE